MGNGTPEKLKDTVELIDFVLELGNGLGRAMQDQKWSLSDAVYFWPAVKALPRAVEGIANIPAGLDELSESDAEWLRAHVAEKFDIPQDSLETVIDTALTIIIELVWLIKNGRR